MTMISARGYPEGDSPSLCLKTLVAEQSENPWHQLFAQVQVRPQNSHKWYWGEIEWRNRCPGRPFVKVARPCEFSPWPVFCR